MRLLEKYYRYDQDMERGGATRRLALRAFTWLALGMLAILTRGVTAVWDSVWFAFAMLPFSLVLGVLVARGAFAALRRAQAYQNGWLEGRHAMLRSLIEAKRRGLSESEWVTAELERDIAFIDRASL